MTDKLAKLLCLNSSFSIQAAMPSEDGKEKKLPTFTMSAYDGGIMSVDYYGPVVINLSGMKAKDITPVLYNHSRYSVENILGQTSKVNIGNDVTAIGAIMSESDLCNEVLTLAKNGYKFQASLGVSATKRIEVMAGESVQVNGKTLAGPFMLAEESELREISIVPLGADSDTETAIAASITNNGKSHKETEMKEGDTKTPEMIRAEAASEHARIERIKTIAKDHPEILAKAITDGSTPEAVELSVIKAENVTLKAQIEADKKGEERPGAPAIVTGAASKADGKTIEAAVALRAGLTNVEKVYSPDVLSKASDLRIHSITDLVRASLACAGKRLDHSRHETREFLQAAFSTRDIANIVSNVANKFIMQGYAMAEDKWRKIASVRPVVDFKANTGVRLVMANLLKNLAPNGEIQHGSLSDETRSVQADTKALMLGVTRKDLINDDLSALTEIPRKLGFAAARTFNTDFWAALVAAVSTKFPSNASLGNYTTGALSLTTLAVADALFGALRDSDGNPIGVEGSMIVTSHTNKAIAREIYTSTTLVGGSSKTGANNVFVGQYEPVITAYLSGAPYFLTSNPMGIPLMEAAFLNGRQEPFVETSDADFNTLGIQMRCYYDYGVAFAENKGTIYSTGQ